MWKVWWFDVMICQVLVRCHTESMWVMGVLLAPFHFLTLAHGLWGNGSIQIWKDRGRQSLQLECLKQRMVSSLGMGKARKAWLCCTLKSCLLPRSALGLKHQTQLCESLWVFPVFSAPEVKVFVKDAEYGVHCQNFRDLSATTDHASAASAQFLCSVMFCHVLSSIEIVRFSTKSSWQLAGLAARASWIWRSAFTIWKGQIWSKIEAKGWQRENHMK